MNTSTATHKGIWSIHLAEPTQVQPRCANLFPRLFDFAAGPQLDLPASVTPSQLETLLNGILANDQKVPYSFYVADLELSTSLGDHLQKHGVSVETALKIVYRPQAVFRVRPISRCTASLAGEFALASEHALDILMEQSYETWYPIHCLSAKNLHRKLVSTGAPLLSFCQLTFVLGHSNSSQCSEHTQDQGSQDLL